jgi:hypothetical protein
MALLVSRPHPTVLSAELLETEIQSVGTHALVALAGEPDLSTEAFSVNSSQPWPPRVSVTSL